MITEIANTPMPTRIANLRRDSRGYPVPTFVEWRDGKPLFPVVSTRHLVACIKHHLCWICGQPLGRNMVFVVGPMCCINRISSEPPSHLDCATYAARVCPFLARPHMKRVPLPSGEIVAPAGIMAEDNPGATALWITRSYEPFRPPVGRDGVLLAMGKPTEVFWYAGGEPAGFEQIMEAMRGGILKLQAIEQAHNEKDGTLDKLIDAAWKTLDLGDRP